MALKNLSVGPHLFSLNVIKISTKSYLFHASNLSCTHPRICNRYDSMFRSLTSCFGRIFPRKIVRPLSTSSLSHGAFRARILLNKPGQYCLSNFRSPSRTLSKISPRSRPVNPCKSFQIRVACNSTEFPGRRTDPRVYKFDLARIRIFIIQMKLSRNF